MNARAKLDSEKLDGDTTYYRASPSIGVQPLWGAHRRIGGRETFQTRPFSPSQNVYAIWLVLSGEVEVETLGEHFSLGAGEAFLHTVVEARNVTVPRNVEWLSVGFRLTLPGPNPVFSDTATPARWRPNPQDYQDMSACMDILARGMEGIVGAFPSAPPRAVPFRATDTMLHESLSRALLCLIWRQRAVTGGGDNHVFDSPSPLDRAALHLQKEPHSSVEEMAQVANLSLAQFRRRFHRWFGMAPHRYIELYRLSLARYLLTTTTLTITEVGSLSGFENAAHFCRAFKKAAGVPPSQFRRMAQPVAGL